MCCSLRRHLLLAASIVLAIAPTDRTSLAQYPNVESKADVDRLVKELSNWGRWGKEDQLGTLNLITPRKRLQAMALVRDGMVVSLARRMETESAPDNGLPFEHTMVSSGHDAEGQWAMDNFNVSYHGVAHTHMDALCHMFYEGRMYNGFSRQQVGPEGAAVLGIENLKSGIFTRGVLIDLPRLRGVRFLEPGSPILPAELDAWEQQVGLKIGAGDVVFVRTGRWARRALHGAWDPNQDGLAGLHASCGKWIRDRDIAMIGSDAALDVIPSGIEGVTHPVHVFTLHAMGVHIFDNCDLEELGRVCDDKQRWEFLITAAPIVVKGGTGSPLNPIATF